MFICDKDDSAIGRKGRGRGLKMTGTIDCVCFHHCSHCLLSHFLLSCLVSHCCLLSYVLFAFFCFFGVGEVRGVQSKRPRKGSCLLDKRVMECLSSPFIFHPFSGTQTRLKKQAVSLSFFALHPLRCLWLGIKSMFFFCIHVESTNMQGN